MADDKGAETKAAAAGEAAKSLDQPGTAVAAPEVDDFGLPMKQFVSTEPEPTEEIATTGRDDSTAPDGKDEVSHKLNGDLKSVESEKRSASHDDDDAKPPTPPVDTQNQASEGRSTASAKTEDTVPTKTEPTTTDPSAPKGGSPPAPTIGASPDAKPKSPEPNDAEGDSAKQETESSAKYHEEKSAQFKAAHARNTSTASALDNGAPSGFSHQQLNTEKEKNSGDGDDDGGWQEMPSYARYDMYDDDDRLIAKEHNEDEIEKYGYAGLGGAGKGYTRVLADDDADSTNSMDDNTQYLFKEANGTSMVDDDETRDTLSQMQATKDLLTEGQRIAYVGVARLEIADMVKAADDLEVTSKTKKETKTAAEAMRMWGQKMMIRLYSHMDISSAEQIMIEQLAEHGVRPGDLTPALHANARVRNPMAKEASQKSSANQASKSEPPSSSRTSLDSAPGSPDGSRDEAPPPYQQHEGEEVPDVKMPSQMPSTEKIDIDLRWTVLCDLFLILIADSIYDARSRVLLERVAKSLDISWIDICKFEKRVTDALEMQQAAEKENWNEEEHLENRRKAAQKRKYVMMGLATVGGGLVIGLSAGLFAPLIGGGLAVGFGLVGINGTGAFLGGVGGAALIASGGATTGGIIGSKAVKRRMGSVSTFEYRPLHNNKRVNLIVTVSGWLTGKMDDVRLPFSTVDPIMGDIYSVLWEPEMLRSTGDTINILATEALTQGLQQVLAGTILTMLMAGLQLPLILTKLSYLIDNPWSVSLDRATAAGLILADSLIERNLGTRPITLVGYSLGARVIFACLQELAKRGAFGLVQNVYMFGSPIVVKKHQYLRARTAVSGRFVNGYHRNDWILGYLFRLTNGGIRRVAGLAPIEDLPWIENMDVTEHVQGHFAYRTAMPVLMMNCGWTVLSEEFTEIEDPDPDNHQGRQRELINEIEEARKALEREGKAGKKKGFSFFGRRRKGEKEDWEVYEDSTSKAAKAETSNANGTGSDSNTGVLFDVDAIRNELLKDANGQGHEEELQVREIKSTLPPMKLDLSSPPLLSAQDAWGSLRESKSVDTLPMRFPNNVRSTSLQVTPSQTRSRSPAGWGYEPEKHDDGMQMTFDTSFDEPRRHSSKHDDGMRMTFDTPFDEPRRSSTKYHDGDGMQMTFDTSFDEPKKSSTLPVDDRAARPEMKTSKTSPNMATSNPWGDPDDDDFGKEKEISMTFA